jgi:small-conductance mechanosensitive channel/tetrahydromethanopterin S-methyltransferase subunit F
VRWQRALAVGLALCLASPLAAGAQGPLDKLVPAKEEPAAAPEPTVAELQAKLEEQRAALEKERAEVAARRGETASPDEESALAAELDVIDRTLGTLSDYAQLLTREVQLAERSASNAPPELVSELGAPPYDLDDLEAIEEAVDSVRQRSASFERNQELIRDEIEASRADLAKREEARRKAREELALVDGTKDPAAAVAARRALRLAELESRRAELRRDMVQRVTKLAEAEAALIAADTEALRAALARVRANLHVSPEAIEARTGELDRREVKLARDQERAAQRVAERETRLARAQRELEAASEPTPALTAEVAAYRAELQTERWRAQLLADRLTRLAAVRELVRGRGRVLRRELSRDELHAASAKLAQALDETQRNLRILDARLVGLREERERALAEAARAAGSEVAPWKERSARALAEAVEEFEAEVKPLTELQALQQRAATDVGERLSGRGIAGAVRFAAEEVAELWDEELASVDDRPITVGKVAIALLVLLLGWLASGLLARLVARLVRRRSHMAEGAVKSLERLAFYVFIALFALIALRLVNIPLTAFTLVGGALAVGVGFGSQNILNNFISGLILLSERPIQIGDIVEVDGTQGEVERIGARSTRIRTFESIHLIVPNSAFLEKTVINLTISDDRARGLVDVGVAYGSDPREVERLLLMVLREHPLVLDDPTPIVLFQDFGDSALVFRCLFWIRDVLQRLRVASDLRYRIDEVFRGAGIEIPFPKRDVHLDARTPLPVRLVREDGPGE